MLQCYPLEALAWPATAGYWAFLENLDCHDLSEQISMASLEHVSLTMLLCYPGSH